MNNEFDTWDKLWNNDCVTVNIPAVHFFWWNYTYYGVEIEAGHSVTVFVALFNLVLDASISMYGPWMAFRMAFQMTETKSHVDSDIAEEII